MFTVLELLRTAFKLKMWRLAGSGTSWTVFPDIGFRARFYTIKPFFKKDRFRIYIFYFVVFELLIIYFGTVSMNKLSNSCKFLKAAKTVVKNLLKAANVRINGFPKAVADVENINVSVLDIFKN